MSVGDDCRVPMLCPGQCAETGVVQILGTSAIAGPAAAGPLAAQLASVEAALERGDVSTARTAVAEIRSLLEPERSGSAERLRVVGSVDLTEREHATLLRLTDGSMSQKDIARDLAVSRNTVKTHLKSIYQKLGVHCRGEAIHRARALGLLPEPLAPAIPLHR